MGNINFLLVFIEGILSLFSPCILPVIPVYLSMLSNSSVKHLEDGEVGFLNSSLFKNTVLFILGISTTFFILGSSIRAINRFFNLNKDVMVIMGGLVIILLGFFYIGYLKLPFLQKHKKIQLKVKEMNGITAFLLGFTFSFGWTPCVGPMLASVLFMASSSSNSKVGNLLILVYSFGFTIPFIIVAIFYSKLFRYINKLKENMNIIQKIGGIILIVAGLIMVLSGSDKTLGYIKKAVNYPIEFIQNKDKNRENENTDIDKAESDTNIDEDTKVFAPDFSLVDQYGNTHKLSDYKGKVVFLNFWATWCPPCVGEMPHIEELYKEYKSSDEDVIILGVAIPNIGREGSKEDITEFLNNKGYTFPVVFDNTAEVIEQYGISAFPTTYIIDKEGIIKGYIPGAMDKSTMKSIINSTY